MSCPSTLAFEGYRWTCQRSAPGEHGFHTTDLPVSFAERGLAVLSWGTSHQAAADDCTPQWTGPIYTEESA
ncbi:MULTISPECIES: hypothetical protein [unclassified Rathayibacter]|uniref:hypothetical protein n=1 Tax=unclassified Rathayibacter TaxID=2609250 RepID=UPI000CE8BB71|nr:MULTISPECIES: hypothetical protein [unclassified Rathayibacter]PPF26291.1 hypothetical protein C5C54_13655 [Rathayibacter sp. AY1F2]PPH42431.1 hypothetical protein C5C42_15210 [Rathayibacter sp. AY1F7]